MGGLLDFLQQQYGDPDDQAATRQALLATGLGLLSSRGSLASALGQAGLQGMAAANDYRNSVLANRVKKAQLDDINAQAVLRKQQADRQARLDGFFFGGDMPAPVSTVRSSTSDSDPGAPQLALADPPPQAPKSGFGTVPMDVARADYMFNGGKGIPQMMWDAQKPQREFQSGVLVDKNQMPAGSSVPVISSNGQASQLVPDPSAPGGYRVVAPRGAVGSYGDYRDADEAAKARYDLVKVFNPETRREEFVPRAQVVGNDPTPSQSPQQTAQPVRQGSQRFVSPEVQAARDRDGYMVLQQELADAFARLQNARDPDTARRAATDLEAIRRELSKRKPSTGAQRFAAGPSSTEAAEADYDKEAQKDFAKRRQAIYEAGDAASGRVADYQRLGSLLDKHDGGSLSPRGLEISKTLNSIGLSVDPAMANKEAATALANKLALELRSPSGGAGMPGALSNSDRDFLSSMVPSLANSAAGRKQMIDYAIAVQQRQQDVAQFARNYEQKYGRLNNGFFDQLSRWSNAHPMFKGSK